MRIRKILKWFLLGLGGVVGLALIGVLVIYIVLGNDFARTFNVPGSNFVVPDDEASITEGKRLATLRGCYSGCHGETANGNIFFDVWDGTNLVSPDIARAVRNYPNEDVERIIRHGVRPDGTSVIRVMPSQMFYNLSDEDLGAIVAYLKTVPPGDEQLPDTSFGPFARLLLFTFKQEIGSLMAAELIDHDKPRVRPARHSLLEHGRYLTLTVCTECHGNDLRGIPFDGTPTLAIVAAYGIDDFRVLMRTGEPIGDRELDLMKEVAAGRFSHFTDREIDALHRYLQTLAATAGDTN